MRRKIEFDLEHDYNNSILAVRPSENGRLAALVKKAGGHDRVWCFSDTREEPFFDDAGCERVPHLIRGVTNGTYDEGQSFLDMCRQLKLVVQPGSFFVPFSNGARRWGQDQDGEDMADWSLEELRLARMDLPTEQQLRELLAVVAKR